VGAKAIVGPGVSIGDGSIVTLGALVTRDLAPRSVFRAGVALTEHA
jgi:acetyltransferase-like isoleucine patch superfamily enzyme